MMAANSNATIDLDHLKRTLHELGYFEPIDPASASLIHHILHDLHQSTKQYEDLLGHYDDLNAQLQKHTENRIIEESRPKIDLNWLDGLDLDINSIDTSLLIDGVDNNGKGSADSLLARVMEQTRHRLETLQEEAARLRQDNERMNKEKGIVEEDLRKAHLASQELSRLLQSKHAQQEGLQDELALLRQQQSKYAHDTATLLPTLTALVKSTISILPADFHAAYTARISTSESLEGLATILGDILSRLKREVEQMVVSLSAVKEERESLRRELEVAQETANKVQTFVSGYQVQIAELTARIHQKDLEHGLQGDLSAQLQAMEGINTMLREKVVALERVANAIVRGEEEQQPGTLKMMVETLASEITTELSFSSHLGQMVDKLNRRRTEQDAEVTKLVSRVRELEGRIQEAEGERALMKTRLDRTIAELGQRDGQMSSSQEVIKSLQEAIRAKDNRIDELQRQAQELKRSVDQLQGSLKSMRKNEDIIKQHAASQDQELTRLRSSMTQIEMERARAVDRTAILEGEVRSLRATLQDKSTEANKYAAELKFAVTAQEKAVMEQRSAKDQVRELEEMVTAKRKEKDLLMTTYCKVIKDNERLHADLKRLQEEFSASRAVDSQSESAMKAYQTKIQIQTSELEQLRKQLGEAEAHSMELERKLDEASRSKKRSEEEIDERIREIGSLKSIISALEQNKKDIAAQMARFGQQASDLRSHLRRVDAERSELQEKLRSLSSSGSHRGDESNHGNRDALLEQINNLNGELDQTRNRIRMLDREKDILEHQLQLERIKSTKLEEILNDNRWKQPSTSKVVPLPVDELDKARKKLQHETEVLRKEHDKGVKSVRRQLMNAAQERSRTIRDRADLFATERLRRRGSDERDINEDGSNSSTPSPPDTPPEDYRKVPIRREDVPSSTEKLRNRNQLLKKELSAIRRDFQNALSPDGSKGLDADVESSILSLTSTATEDEQDDGRGVAPRGHNSAGGRSRIITQREELKRQFEHENRIMEQIIQKVRQDLAASVKGNNNNGSKGTNILTLTPINDAPTSITT